MLQECLFFCFLFWDLLRFVNEGNSGRAFLLTRQLLEFLPSQLFNFPILLAKFMISMTTISMLSLSLALHSTYPHSQSRRTVASSSSAGRLHFKSVLFARTIIGTAAPFSMEQIKSLSLETSSKLSSSVTSNTRRTASADVMETFNIAGKS